MGLTLCQKYMPNIGTARTYTWFAGDMLHLLQESLTKGNIHNHKQADISTQFLDKQFPVINEKLQNTIYCLVS